MKHHCLRCTDNVDQLTLKGIPLCRECALTIGDQPAPGYDICVLCGDRWHRAEILFCEQCFKEEPIQDRYTH